MTSRHRRRVAAVALLAGLAAGTGTAAAQTPTPSLTIDTGFAFSGTARYDALVGAPGSVDDAAGAAVDPTRGRLYVVGTSTTAPAASTAIVVARSTDGSLDRSFDTDGALLLAGAAGRAVTGAALAVLPDGRLRILATVEEGTPGPTDRDLVVFGRLADGTPDPDFGAGGTAVVTRTGTDEAAGGIAVGPDGTLAVTGRTGTGAAADTLVATLSPDGQPSGTTTLDLGAGAADGGTAIAWGPAGPAVLAQQGDAQQPTGALVQSLTPAGAVAGSPVALPTGGTRPVAGGLAFAAGRAWATGSTDVGTDTDAYLARIDPDGTTAVRRFDFRGSRYPASQQVASTGRSVALVAGDPETLVVAGAVTTDAGSLTGAAAFNALDGPLEALGTTDVVLPADAQATGVGAAGGNGGEVAIASALLDRTVTGGGSGDTSLGVSRLLVDAEKRCDLALRVTDPLELRIPGRGTAPLGLQVANVGSRPCAGTVTVPATYTLDGTAALPVGRLAPGTTVALRPQVAFTGPLGPRDQLPLTLVAPDDAQPGDNVARVGVRFAYCDLRLARLRTPSLVPTKGRSTFAFTLRNAGTVDCRTRGVREAAPAVRLGRAEEVVVPAGRSVTEAFDVRLASRTAAGRLTLTFSATSPDDVDAAPDAVRLRPFAVRPPTTTPRVRVTGRRITVSGRAAAGRAPGVKRSQLRVRRVQVALRATGKACRWAAPGGGLRRVVGACTTPVWLNAKGTSRFEVSARRLPAGRYRIVTRAQLAGGLTGPEASLPRAVRVRTGR